MSRARSRRRAYCQVCGEERAFHIWGAGIDECEVCGFRTSLELPDDEEIRALYSATYFRGAEYLDYVERSEAIERTLERRRAEVAAAGGLAGNLLEVGCAFGYFLNACREDFEAVVGVDVSSAAVTHARDVLGLDARCGEIGDAALPAGWADTACCWDTIEHVRSPEACLRQIFKTLRPGGRLFLTTGDVGSLVARARGTRWRLVHPPTHLHFFSRATMRALLERLGFVSIGFRTSAVCRGLDSVVHALQLRGYPLGGLARRPWLQSTLGRARFWLDLGDIMLASARKPPSWTERAAAPLPAGERGAG